ncbi:MAG: c-type cytochrome [Hydrococcus sp. RM1_1_31]|nr:c-type cytochrome [Hydrococcus sp. RM1_1_31]
MKRILISILMISMVIIACQAPAFAENISNGAKIFNVQCAGCHPNGGNIIRRGKSLQKKALQRNKMDSLEAVQEIVTNGKNNMSAFGDRLSQQEIEIVSAYVLEQAENNWK